MINGKPTMEQLAKEALEIWANPTDQGLERIAEISQELGFSANERNLIQFLNGK